jgi:peroxiredoxin
MDYYAQQNKHKIPNVTPTSYAMTCSRSRNPPRYDAKKSLQQLAIDNIYTKRIVSTNDPYQNAPAMQPQQSKKPLDPNAPAN